METLTSVRNAGMKICCGGIIGMGESRRVRASLIAQLAAMNPPPESVPINHLVAVPGTPLENRAARSLRIRPHHRRRAHHHAALLCAAFRRSPGT